MGISQQGVYGNYRRKVGNVVARIEKGRTILSIYNPTPRNPRTAKQTEQRDRFALLVSFCRRLAGWARVMCTDDSRYGNTFNNLVHLAWNKGAGVNTEAPYEVIFDKMLMSAGIVPMAPSMDAVVDAGIMSLSWSALVDNDSFLATDVPCLLVYNPVKEQALYSTSEGKRTDRQLNFTLPTSWTGDVVYAWVAFRRADNSAQGDSVYLGNFSI